MNYRPFQARSTTELNRHTKIILRVVFTILALAAPPARSQSREPVPSPKVTSAAPILYLNREYGFHIALPPDWTGYTVLVSRSEATAAAVDTDTAPQPPKERFTVITLRHPAWTKAHPHEDLPIMIFTLAQWKRVISDGSDGLVVSAAPFPPSELSRNKRFVFALPARYNFDYAAGWQELESLLATHSFNGY